MSSSGATESAAIRDVLLSEERCRAFIAAIAQIVWTTDARGRVIEDQAGWRAFTGQTCEEIQGAGWLQAVDPNSRVEALSSWTQAVERGLPYETEWRLRRRDGEYRFFSIRAVPVRAADGAVGEWIGCNLDITDRKQRDRAMEQRSREIEQRSRDMEILRNLGDTMQACNSREEAYPFIALAASELFLGARGALAVPVAGARELLETVTEWGGEPQSESGYMKRDFAMEDCWALRRGGIHESGAATVCQHFGAELRGPHACVPLMVRGGVSGL